jgi:hypothetical protein
MIFVVSEGESSCIMALGALQKKGKGRFAHATDGEPTGAANKDEESGSRAYPQGDEFLPGRQAVAANNF